MQQVGPASSTQPQVRRSQDQDEHATDLCRADYNAAQCCPDAAAAKGVAARQVQEAHVLLNEIQAAIIWHEGCNLLPILDQLDTRALPDSRVGLLGLNTAAHGHYKVRSQIKA